MARAHHIQSGEPAARRDVPADKPVAARRAHLLASAIDYILKMQSIASTRRNRPALRADDARARQPRDHWQRDSTSDTVCGEAVVLSGGNRIVLSVLSLWLGVSVAPYVIRDVE